MGGGGKLAGSKDARRKKPVNATAAVCDDRCGKLVGTILLFIVVLAGIFASCQAFGVRATVERIAMSIDLARLQRCCY